MYARNVGDSVDPMPAPMVSVYFSESRCDVICEDVFRHAGKPHPRDASQGAISTTATGDNICYSNNSFLYRHLHSIYTHIHTPSCIHIHMI